MTTTWSSSSEAAPGAASDAPLVEVRGLGVCYRLAAHHAARRRFLRRGKDQPHLLWALRDLSFRLDAGATLGIVGGNGAGKSTLCSVMAGILRPDEGRATVRGRVATLFGLGQGFHRELSGRENVRLYASLLGIPRRVLRERMDEIIDFSELGGFIEEPVAHYSSGMRARLAFSVAMALEADVMLLDEVLSVGDRAFRAKSRAELQARMARSRFVGIVSHNTELLRELCTHALWLERGRLRRFGGIGEVLDAYEHASDSGRRRPRLIA
jgi:ABC-type polysaccharide/polyol phosphate transport system ATPase subunit